MKRGHLHHEGGNRWRYRLTAGTHPDGRPRVWSQNFRAPNLTAARKVATGILREWDQQLATEATFAGSVDDLVTAYETVVAKEHSPATIARNRSIHAAIRRDLGRIQAGRLTAKQIDMWLRSLPLKPATVHHYYRQLHAILQRADDWGEIPNNPATKAKPPKFMKTDTSPTMPQVADVQAMMAMASPSVRLAILLAVTTGMRRGELMGLWWSAVDLEATPALIHVRQAVVQVGGRVYTKDPKTAKGRRTIAVPEVTRWALVEHREQLAAWITERGHPLPADGPVLAHLRADPTGRTGYAPDWLSREWERLRIKAGRPTLQLKGLRALNASILAGAATSVATTADRLGHASPTTTLGYYTHALTAADTVAAEVIGKALET